MAPDDCGEGVGGQHHEVHGGVPARQLAWQVKEARTRNVPGLVLGAAGLRVVGDILPRRRRPQPRRALKYPEIRILQMCLEPIGLHERFGMVVAHHGLLPQILSSA